eukprot:gene10399-biopygen7542
MEVYLLVAVDDHSGWNAVVPMRLKSESAGWIIAIIRNWMGLLLGIAFRCLRTDQAKEFLVPELTNWLASVQAKHEVSSVYCPQQNGVAERFNGVVASMARTMLIESKMSKGFWTYAFTCASYLRNRLPSKRGATPYERFFGQVPDVSLLRVFGTRCYVKLLDGKTRSKTDERAIRGRLVGYSSLSKAYQIWIPEQYKVVVARDVVFFEGSGPGPVLGQVPYDGSPFSEASSPAVIGEGPPVVVGIEHDAAHLVNGPDAGFHMNLRSRKSAEPIDAGVPAVRYPPELPPAPILDPIPLSPSLGVEEPEPADAFISEPINLTYERAVALDNPDREHWLLAMRDEMASLEGHQTWTLTPLPRGCKTITGRWLFTIQNGVDGQPERYKARFVARGFLQREGIDYDLTFAPVTSKTTLRVFLAGMVHRKMFPRQLDIKTAFLNATLEEGLDLYLAQPEGFEVGKGLVCKIIKSLYGLKQAPRLWSAEFCRVLRLCGFRPTASDPALFVRLEADGNWSWVTTYVDDFWLALDELFLYIAIIEIMRQEGWTVTEMGVPRMFLSLDCDLSLDAEGRCDKIVISQRTAIQGMLERFRIGKGEATRASVAVPMVSGAVTTQAEGSRVLPNNRTYSSLIGRRSQTGLAVLASGGVVSWVSKRQITPALSTGEAEYQALAAAAREVQWLKHLRADLGLPCKLVTIRCDASVSLSWCADYKHEPRAKHIDIIHHYVKDLVLSKRLGTVKVHTSLQVADTFTKPLTADVFWSMNGMLGLVDVKELKPPSK